MPQDFASYDLNQDGLIGQDEWANFYPDGGGPATRGIGSQRMPGMQNDIMLYQQPQMVPFDGGSTSMDMGFDPADVVSFFQNLTDQFQGFEFTPEMLEAFGTILPALGIYGEMSKAEYQQDALDFAREELGLKGIELDIMRQQLQFQQGEYWDWYTSEFFPMTQETQRAQWEAEGTVARERTYQAEEASEQARMATEMARYNMMSQMQQGGQRPRQAQTIGYGF